MIWFIVILLSVFGGFLLYITLSDYRPAAVEVLFKEDPRADLIPPDRDTFSLISWNIGYAGLGAEMDFFYDGGRKVRPAKEQSQHYLKGIRDFIIRQPADFYLLQEVDVRSKRSFGVDQAQALRELRPDYNSLFALNYRVPFVPVPLRNPMGRVKGGLMILSKDHPYHAERIAYPLIASWPDRLFLLDRCFILSRYRLAGDRDLVVINTHNSAYVYDTALRKQEYEIIRRQLVEEYARGNYVIAGGDWNASPPGFEPDNHFNGHRYVTSRVFMEADFLAEGWSWAYDTNRPTNRHNDMAFQKGVTGTTLIDFFVVSPNVEVLTVENIDLDFVSSDHNPVLLKVRLKR